MILLYFGEKTMAAEVMRPSFYESVYEVLKEYLAEEIANLHAQRINRYLKVNMEFPADGIYTVCKGKLLGLVDGKWNTDGTLEKYYLKEDSQVFDCLNGYATEIVDKIKDVAIKLMEEMFTSCEAHPCEAISVEPEGRMNLLKRAVPRTEAVKQLVAQFFSEKMVPAVTEKIWSEIFGIPNGTGLISIQYPPQGNVLMVSATETYAESYNPKLRDYIAQYLMDSTEEFLLRLRNVMIYGVDTYYRIDYVLGDYAYRESGGRVARFSLSEFEEKNNGEPCWYILSTDVEKDILEEELFISEDGYRFLVRIPGTDFSVKLFLSPDDNQSLELDCKNEQGLIITQNSGQIECLDEEYYFNHLSFAKWVKNKLRPNRATIKKVMEKANGRVWLDCSVNNNS